MNVETRVENNTLFIDLDGRLDTITSQQLGELLPNEKRRNLDIDFNFEKLEYISSAGLRALLSLKKNLSSSGKELEVHNLNPVCQEVFKVTGFNNILTIK